MSCASEHSFIGYPLHYRRRRFLQATRSISACSLQAATAGRGLIVVMFGQNSPPGWYWATPQSGYAEFATLVRRRHLRPSPPLPPPQLSERAGISLPSDHLPRPHPRFPRHAHSRYSYSGAIDFTSFDAIIFHLHVWFIIFKLLQLL